jgi:hypothetical protein
MLCTTNPRRDFPRKRLIIRLEKARGQQSLSARVYNNEFAINMHFDASGDLVKGTLWCECAWHLVLIRSESVMPCAQGL